MSVESKRRFRNSGYWSVMFILLIMTILSFASFYKSQPDENKPSVLQRLITKFTTYDESSELLSSEEEQIQISQQLLEANSRLDDANETKLFDDTESDYDMIHKSTHTEQHGDSAF